MATKFYILASKKCISLLRNYLKTFSIILFYCFYFPQGCKILFASSTFVMERGVRSLSYSSDFTLNRVAKLLLSSSTFALLNAQGCQIFILF